MEAPILGRGANDAQEAFNKARTESLDETFKHFWQPTDFVDSHNQYIQTTMEFNIIEIYLLLFIYFSPLRGVAAKPDRYPGKNVSYKRYST